MDTTTTHQVRGKIVLATPSREEAVHDFQELVNCGYDVECVASTRDLLQLSAHGNLDTIVSDLEFPEDPEMDFLRAVHAVVCRGVRFIATTRRPSLDSAVRAMRAGAEDYLVRPFEPRALLRSLERPRTRSTPPPEPARPASQSVPAYWAALSEREREVVDALYSGKSPRQIADSLAISHYTVRNHLRSIYSKLGIHSQRELLSLGAPQGPASR